MPRGVCVLGPALEAHAETVASKGGDIERPSGASGKAAAGAWPHHVSMASCLGVCVFGAGVGSLCRNCCK